MMSALASRVALRIHFMVIVALFPVHEAKDSASSNNSGCSLISHQYRTSLLSAIAAESATPAAAAEVDTNQSCAELVNHGTHFTIDIEVGTPGQKFSVVADTGSNSLIIPSCVCADQGYCGKDSRCFRGTNKSSTFSISGTGAHDDGPTSILITFGSGTVEAVVAEDVVQVGNIKANMQDGLLLMTDKALRFPGPFEGILGLGVPLSEETKTLEKTVANRTESDTNQTRSSANQSANRSERKSEPLPKDIADDILKKIIKRVIGSGDLDDLLPSGDNGVQPVYSDGRDAGASGSDSKGGIMATKTLLHQPKGFLEQAKVPRFSMCFNDGENGVLRIGGATPSADALGTIGQRHWGLDFRGMSIRNESLTQQLSFCSPENMTKGQASPCGAIPDSGTTNIMMPSDHLEEVLNSLCDSWPRCQKNFTALVEAAEAASEAAKAKYTWNPFEIEVATKADVFQLLLLDCEAWLNDEGSDGLAELPDISLHVVGTKGGKQELKLPARAYIIEQQQEDVEYVYKHMKGVGDIPVGVNRTGKMHKVCAPAMSSMEYTTKDNGPVWILGTPIFYQFVVGYDMGDTPPSVSFTSTETASCGSCKSDVGFVSTKRVAASKTTAADRKPRRVYGKPRVPTIDTSEPL